MVDIGNVKLKEKVKRKIKIKQLETGPKSGKTLETVVSKFMPEFVGVAGIPHFDLPEASPTKNKECVNVSPRNGSMEIAEDVAMIVVEGNVSGSKNYQEDGCRRGYEPETYSRLFFDCEQAKQKLEREEAERIAAEAAAEAERQRMADTILKLFGDASERENRSKRRTSKNETAPNTIQITQDKIDTETNISVVVKTPTKVRFREPSK